MSQEIQNILPNAVDLEKAVLGAMLIDYDTVGDVLEVLNEDSFYKTENKIIFNAISEVYNDDSSVDLLTVNDQLNKKELIEKAGGVKYLVELSQMVASTAHTDRHIRIIQQKYIQRQVIALSSNLLRKSYESNVDVFELLDLSYSKLNEVSDTTIKKQEATFASIIDVVQQNARDIYNGVKTPGLITPIKSLTYNAGGWKNEELIILAARPGMGKTSFALKAALILSKINIPVAFFCLEMSNESLVSRCLSMETKIPLGKFINDGLNDYENSVIDKKKIEFKELPFFVEDSASMSIEQLQIKAKRLKKNKGIKAIFVDYLQLMTSTSVKGNREQEISSISRGLKKVAKELKIPIIALSQLSRSVETRGGSKRPLLSDLRESGAIEQDADKVMFLYRPEYYGITEWDDDEHTPCEGQAECIVAKNRNGALTRVRMKFDGKFTLFSDIYQEETTIDDLQNLIEPEKNINLSPEEAFGDDVPF